MKKILISTLALLAFLYSNSVFACTGFGCYSQLDGTYTVTLPKTKEDFESEIQCTTGLLVMETDTGIYWRQVDCGTASPGYVQFWPTITGNLTETGSGVLTITGGAGAVVGSGSSIQVKQAGTSQSGFLSSGDWNAFNGKQPALSGTGFVKISGSTISYDNSTYLTTTGNGSGITSLTAANISAGTAGIDISGNSATVTSISGKINAGTNISVTGSGTSASPYVVNSSLGAFSIGSPNAQSMSLSTAYQCTNTSKPCLFTITTNCPITGFGGQTTCAGEIRIGSNNNIASGASGTALAPLQRSFTGLSALLTFGNSDNDTTLIPVPAGWYITVRQLSGTSLTVQSAYDQSMSN